MQLVVPSNNPNNAYLRFTDHAYANLKSPDKGEFPSLTDSPIARLISGDLMGTKPHTGGFKGYPSRIKGDQITRYVPKGLSVDVLTSDALLSVDDKKLNSYEAEHVIPTFFENFEVQLIKDFAFEGEDRSIDTIDDYAKLFKI